MPDSVQIDDRRSGSNSPGRKRALPEKSTRVIVAEEDLLACVVRVAELQMNHGAAKAREHGLESGKAPAHYRRRTVELAASGQLMSGLINKGLAQHTYINNMFIAIDTERQSIQHNQYNGKWAIETIVPWRGEAKKNVPPDDILATGEMNPVGERRATVIMESEPDSRGRAGIDEVAVIGYTLTFVDLINAPDIVRLNGQPVDNQPNENNSAGAIAAAIRDAVRPQQAAAADEGEKLHHKTRERMEREAAERDAEIAKLRAELAKAGKP